MSVKNKATKIEPTFYRVNKVNDEINFDRLKKVDILINLSSSLGRCRKRERV